MAPKGSIPNTGAIRGVTHIKTRPSGSGQDFAKMYINFMQLGRHRRTRNLFSNMVKSLDQEIKSYEDELRHNCVNAEAFLLTEEKNKKEQDDSIAIEF
jgi:hypothetical protein